jgi:hypothetical protein
MTGEVADSWCDNPEEVTNRGRAVNTFELRSRLQAVFNASDEGTQTGSVELPPSGYHTLAPAGERRLELQHERRPHLVERGPGLAHIRHCGRDQGAQPHTEQPPAQCVFRSQADSGSPRTL